MTAGMLVLKQITIKVIGRRKNTLHRAVSLRQHGSSLGYNQSISQSASDEY